MAEELDEFGIPVRRSKPNVDEFGIPLKKKAVSQPGGVVSATGSEPFQQFKPGFKGSPLDVSVNPDKQKLYQKSDGPKSPEFKYDKDSFSKMSKSLYDYQQKKVSDLKDFSDPTLNALWKEVKSVKSDKSSDPIGDFAAYVMTSVPEFIPDRVKNAWESGLLQGEQASIVNLGYNEMTTEDANKLSQIQSQLESFEPSKESLEFQKGGLSWALKNPLDGAKFIGETIVNSLASRLSAMKRTVPAGAAVGAAAGVPFAGIGAIPGAIIGIQAGTIMAGINLETSQKILDSIRDSGFDLKNPDDIMKAFSDKEKMEEFREAGLKRGVPIALIDIFSAGIAGKVASGGSTALSSAGRKAAGLAIEGAGGSVGELAAQVSAGERIDPNVIGLEFFAELGGGAPTLAAGVTSERLIQRQKTTASDKNIARQVSSNRVAGDEEAKLNVQRLAKEGLISESEVPEAVSVIEKSKLSDEKIPDNVTGEARAESIVLINRKMDLQKNIDDLSLKKDSLDEIYHTDIDNKIGEISNKIKSINNDLIKIQSRRNAVQKPSTESQVPPVIEGGEVAQEGGEGVGQGVEGIEATQEVIPEEQVRVLREQEQQELAEAIPNIEEYKTNGKIDKGLITNPEDLKKYEAIYDKYDKLITPLLAKAPQKVNTEESTGLSRAKKILSIVNGNISRLAGSSNIEKRIAIIEGLTGKRVSKANAGVNAVAQVVKSYVGLKPDSVAGEYEQIKNWAEGKSKEVKSQDSEAKGVRRESTDLDIAKSNLKFAEIAKNEATEYLNRYKNNPFADKVSFNKAKLADANKKIKKLTQDISKILDVKLTETEKNPVLYLYNGEKVIKEEDLVTKQGVNYKKVTFENGNNLLIKEKDYKTFEEQKQPAQPSKEGVRTVKLEVNNDLSSNGIGLRAVEGPDGKFTIRQEIGGKIVGKSLGKSFDTIEQLQQEYDGGIKDVITSDAIREAQARDLANAKVDVDSARGKQGKTNALVVLRDVATEEQFQEFLDENPKFNKYVEGGTEQKRLGASRIVGEPVAEEEFAEFEELPDENAESMLKDSIETPFRNKEKLQKASGSIVKRIVKALFESQFDVIDKLMKKGGDVGRIAKAALKNRKGYNGMSSIVNMENNKNIFDNLGISPNIDIAGRKVSESDLFDVVLNLKRIISIDNRIAEKFSELVGLDKKLKVGIKDKSLSSNQIFELKSKIENLKDYLESRKAIRKFNGEYQPVQYIHSGGRTAASARAELKLIESKLPDVYKKLDDLAFKYNDAYRSLLDLQYENNMISKSVYDELYSYNYIPTKYIQHFIENELSQDSPAYAAKLSSSIKNLTGGSDSDVITNFKSILEIYTNSVYRRVYENRAAMSMARAVRDTGVKSTDLAKLNQAVKATDADITSKEMYNMDLGMYIQEPSGKDKYGNPTYGSIPTGYDVIYFYEGDGNKRRIVAPKDFVDSWYDKAGQLSPFADKWINRLSRWSLVNLFKSVITKHNPAFGIFQITMDAPQALIATEAYPDFVVGSMLLAKDYASVSKDIFKFVKNNELTPLFKEAIDAGIFSDFLSTEGDLSVSTSLVNSDGSTNYNTALKLLMSKVKRGANTALDGIAKMNEGVEYATRLAVYKRMKQNLVAKYTKQNNGIEPTESQMFDIRMLSAEQARNVVDFSRSGTFIKPLNKVLAYLNAGIQAFYASAKSLKNNPTKAAVLFTEIGVGAVAAMAMSLGAYGDDREKKKRLAEYLKLSGYQRANYINIYNPYTDDEEKRWIKINKPQVFRGYMNMLEQAFLHNVMGIDIDEATIKEAFLNDLPVDPFSMDLLTRNPMINGIIKYGLNKDAFRSEDVVKNEEKIEDWAEGANDKNVSKFYKSLGEHTRGLLGTEGISPKRAQAFAQSLIGDPSRNTTTAVLDKAGKALFYSLTGDSKSLDEEMPEDFADGMFKLSGLKGRVFTKTPSIDNSFMESLEKEQRKTYTANYVVRGDVKEIRESVEKPEEGLDLIFNYLKERVASKDITPEYAQRVMNSQAKLYYLKDAPSFYDDVMYGQDNESKSKILNNYTKDMSDKEVIDVFNDMLANKIISMDVVKSAIELREKTKNK